MKQTILILDDQPGTRRLLRNVLERDGYAVIEAATEADAWKALQGGGVTLALVDLELPGVWGTDVARRLRMLTPVSVVFMSGHGRQRLLSDGRLDSDAPFLAKPFQLEDVRAAIGRELN